MPTIHAPKLLKADVLKNMKPSSIQALLGPFADYFNSRDVRIDDVPTSGFNFATLATVLAFSTEKTPPRLVENLNLLDLISDSNSAMNFEIEYHEVVRSLREPDDTHADLAVKIILKAPEVALREYNRQALLADRSLVSLRLRPGMRTQQFIPASIETLKSILSKWYRDNNRSEACIIHHLHEANGEAFVIRHGDTMKRIGVLEEDGSQNSQIFRPEVVDIANFNRLTGEWQVSGRGAKLQDLYRRAFGIAFHGSENALVFSNRYSLEPLRDGPSCLACDFDSPVHFAELKSLKLETSNGQLFAICNPPVFEAIHETIGAAKFRDSKLVEAIIHLKIQHRRAMAPVKIRPDKDVICGNNIHPAIDPWLSHQRFANDDVQLLASA